MAQELIKLGAARQAHPGTRSAPIPCGNRNLRRLSRIRRLRSTRRHRPHQTGDGRVGPDGSFVVR